MPWYTTDDARRDAEKQSAANMGALQSRELQTLLDNLLAVIHRDGGHYQCEHGTKKACEDAQRRVSETHGAADELAMLVRRLARALQKAAPDNGLPKKAMDYLNIVGLSRSPMRGVE